MLRFAKRGQDSFVRSTLRAVPAKGSGPLFAKLRLERTDRSPEAIPIFEVLAQVSYSKLTGRDKTNLFRPNERSLDHERLLFRFEDCRQHCWQKVESCGGLFEITGFCHVRQDRRPKMITQKSVVRVCPIFQPNGNLVIRFSKSSCRFSNAATPACHDRSTDFNRPHDGDESSSEIDLPTRIEGLASWIRSRLSPPVYVPVLLLIVLTVAFRVSDADLEICRLVYGFQGRTWLESQSGWSFWIYEYGPIPGLMLGLGGLLIAITGLFWRRLKPYRGAGVFLALLLALGPGLIVNGVFKPNWHRPRPLQTLAFGGNQAFVRVWGIGSGPRSKSFPSGHASMGFYLMAPAFLLYRKRRSWALAFVALGLACGLIIGTGRMMQGAHYASDVLWSAGMVYLTGMALLGVFELTKLATQRTNTAGELPQEAVIAFPIRNTQRDGSQRPAEIPTRRAA